MPLSCKSVISKDKSIPVITAPKFGANGFILKMLFFATVFFILLALVFKFKFCLQYVKTLDYLDLNYLARHSFILIIIK